MKAVTLSLKIIVLLFMAISTAMAQRIEEQRLPYRHGQQIVFDLPIGKSIRLTGWDREEIALVARVTINNNQLNDAWELQVSESTDLISLKAGFDEERLKNANAEDCNGNPAYQTTLTNQKVAICAEIYYEIKVPRQADISLKTISADVEASGLEGPSQIKAISGFIDFSWPQQKGAELQLKSITGELYTDLDFDILNKKDSPPIVGYTLKGRNKNGGPVLELETISSNIYFRNQ